MTDIPTFPMKRNDTDPAYRVQLYDIDENGTQTVANLGIGSSVVFNMTPLAGGPAKVDRGTVTINDAASGDVEYRWQSGDTNEAGVFRTEFEVTFSNGRRRTYPREGYGKIKIDEDLG